MLRGLDITRDQFSPVFGASLGDAAQKLFMKVEPKRSQSAPETQTRRADSNCRPAVYEVVTATHETDACRTFGPVVTRAVVPGSASTAARIAAHLVTCRLGSWKDYQRAELGPQWSRLSEHRARPLASPQTTRSLSVRWRIDGTTTAMTIESDDRWHTIRADGPFPLESDEVLRSGPATSSVMNEAGAIENAHRRTSG